jgi:hypothetical protein
MILQPVPYRGMPLGYVAAWVAFTGLAVLYQSGVPESNSEWAILAVGALVGGALWGWILWRLRFWLYRKFPARLG